MSLIRSAPPVTQPCAELIGAGTAAGALVDVGSRGRVQVVPGEREAGLGAVEPHEGEREGIRVAWPGDLVAALEDGDEGGWPRGGAGHPGHRHDEQSDKERGQGDNGERTSVYDSVHARAPFVDLQRYWIKPGTCLGASVTA